MTLNARKNCPSRQFGGKAWSIHSKGTIFRRSNETLPEKQVHSGQHCAPSRIQNAGRGTCFNADELRALAKAYNAHSSAFSMGGSLEGNQKGLSLSQEGPIAHVDELNETDLLLALQKRLAPVCGDQGETCWLEQRPLLRQIKKDFPLLYESIVHEALKPKGKKKKHEWLSSVDIERVMKQYQTVYKDFKFIGALPSDYFEVYPDQFPYEALDKFRQLAIVFNLDRHDQSGSHWVAVFFSRDSPDRPLSIEYFDSTGYPPNARIKRFLRHPYFHGSTYVQNGMKHQRANSECGVYSLFFILQRLNGLSMNDVNRRRIADAEMNAYRSQIFRPFGHGET